MGYQGLWGVRDECGVSKFGFGVSRPNLGCQGRIWDVKVWPWGIRAEFGVSRFGFGVSRPNLGSRGQLRGVRSGTGEPDGLWHFRVGFGVSGRGLWGAIPQRARSALAFQDWLWDAGGHFRAGFGVSGGIFGVSGGFWGSLNPDPSAQRAPLPPSSAPCRARAVAAVTADAAATKWRRPPRPSRVPPARTPAGPEPRAPAAAGPRAPAAPRPRRRACGRPWSGAAPSTRCPRRSARYELWKCRTLPTLGERLLQQFRDAAQACEPRCIVCTFWSWVRLGVGFPHSLCSVIAVIL